MSAGVTQDSRGKREVGAVSDSERQAISKRRPLRREHKPDYTFKSLESAKHIINPVLRNVLGMIRRDHEQTVPGFLNRLSMWLLRMERGNRHDARTPIFKRYSYSQIAGMITNTVKASMSRLTKMYSGSPGFPKDILAVEEHQAEKIGSRGVFPPASEWLDAKIDAIWSDKPPRKDLNEAALKRSLLWLSKQVPAHSIDVDALSIEEGFKNAGTDKETELSLNTDTNSCYPTYVRKWYHSVWTKAVSVNQRLVQVILTRQARYYWKKMLGAASYRECTFHFVATASQRTNVASGHEATKDNTYHGIIMSKLRAVCAMPKMDTILGKPILNRLLQAARTYFLNPDGTHMFSALLEPERIDKNFEVALQGAKRRGITLLGTDFSGYDASVPPWLIFQVAQAMCHWMTPRCARIFLGLVYSATYNTSCITTTRVVEPCPSSIKSGSWMTNIMDSMINLVSQRYGLESGVYKSIYWQFVQGDDAVLGGDNVNPETFESVVSQLGFEGNASKQYYEEGSTAFCQKLYFCGYPGGIYPIARATAAIVSLEDDVGIETDQAGQFPYVLSYRTLCRLDNAAFNPNFKTFVELVASEDQLHLGRHMDAGQLAKLAGSYASRMTRESLDKPWKAPAYIARQQGFAMRPVNRVLRGELPPPPGYGLYEWVHGVKFNEVSL